MKVLDIVKNLFSEKNIKITLLVGIVIFMMLWLKSCNDARDAKSQAEIQLKINEQNLRAANDSIRIMKTKNGELEAVKSSFVSKLEDLQSLNENLYAEVKKEIGTVKSLIKAQGQIGRDNVVMSNELKKYPDGKTFGLLFKDIYSDSALTWTLKGESKFQMENNTIFPGKTIIEENRLKVKLVMGFKENKDNFEVFARSASPYVSFNDLDGVLLIPKKNDITTPPAERKKRFGLGPNISVGIGANFKPSIYVGFGLQYNLIRF